MNAAAFLLSLGRRTHTPSRTPDPLQEARGFLDVHGDTTEGQALRKVLKAIADTNGDFADTEIWLFSSETLALVAALVEARIEGRYTVEEWTAFN